VVVDCDVHEVPPAPLPVVINPAAVHPPPAAVRYPAELLDVDVQQLTWPVPFVADVGGSLAHELAGELVNLRQVRDLPAPQLGGHRCAGRAVTWPGRSVDQAGHAFPPGAGGPAY
jgi:hypothetical protein